MTAHGSEAESLGSQIFELIRQYEDNSNKEIFIGSRPIYYSAPVPPHINQRDKLTLDLLGLGPHWSWFRSRHGDPNRWQEEENGTTGHQTMEGNSHCRPVGSNPLAFPHQISWMPIKPARSKP
jgi:hypothetical protein